MRSEEQKGMLCHCKKQIKQSQFKNHFKYCDKYEGIILSKMKKFAKSVSDSTLVPTSTSKQINKSLTLIKMFAAEVQLSVDILKELFEKVQKQKGKLFYDNYASQYLILQQGLIQQMIKSQNSLFQNQNRKKPNIDIGCEIKQNQNNLFNNIPLKHRYSQPVASPNLINQPARQVVSCKICSKKLDTFLDIKKIFSPSQCWHKFCKDCMRDRIQKQFVSRQGLILCPIESCKKPISQNQIKDELVGLVKWQLLQKQLIKKNFNIQSCRKCGFQFQFQSLNMNLVPNFDKNRGILSSQSRNHYANNRFICPNSSCRCEQCKSCKQTPYHIGYNCKQFAKRKQLILKRQLKFKNCRFCSEKLTPQNSPNNIQQAFIDICNSLRCVSLSKQFCDKILKCGHSCGGFRGQQTCLTCLNYQCCKDKAQMNGQRGIDKCKLCQFQILSGSPCIKSSCGHIFHQKCLKKRFQQRWKNKRISFSFCLCPICKKWINVQKQSKLSALNDKNLQLFNKIQSLSIQRLRFEGHSNDRALSDLTSPFYKNQYSYSMALYSYFQCNDCKMPYYGGIKNPNQSQDKNNLYQQIKDQQLICPACKPTVNFKDCEKHGKKFMSFKCRFCCSIAQFLVNNTVHYCQSCYKLKDFISRVDKQKLPSCLQQKCPIGGNHSGNGQQRVLRCAACRYSK